MKKNLCLLVYYLMPFVCFAQFSVSGKITDANGLPLVGANVFLEKTNKATATNLEGNFSLEKIPTGDYVMVISFVGFETIKKNIQITQDLVLDLSMKISDFLAEEIVVNALRANENSPFAFTNIDKKDLQKQNLGQDLPQLLNFMPSVVSTSDAGAGVGYTGIRIRGSDATRINVTINGIPLNDTESQGVFWVNMPDFASSVSSIQVQRGVGTSTNGAGAFGASVNIQTNQFNEQPFAEISNSYGSFNTWKHTLQFGSGLINGKFSLDARLSAINSDGFIDRSKTDLKSFYVSAGYYLKKSTFKVNVFSGKEQTYQAWNGVPESRLRGDVQGMNDFIIRNGLDEADASNLLNSNSRTYNFYTYDNQTDNYQQDHYQAFFNTELSEKWNLNTGLHYTRGRGYFEEFRKNDTFATYNLENVIIGNEIIETTDLIRRRWLDNHFYGLVFSLNYHSERLDFNFGGSAHQYKGRHFGEIIWAEYASNSQIREKYYDNDANKSDYNAYAKIFYQLNDQFNIFTDLQYRGVNYSFLGFTVDNLGARNLEQTVNLNFFNPKIGFTWNLNEKNAFYASFAVGNKEPNRDDFTQSSAQSRPKHETLYDIELGLRKTLKNFALNLNLYQMYYRNQLVLTGKVNDVGAYTRTNIDRSYRAGIEIEMAYQPFKQLTWQFNAAFSQNKIQNFAEYTDDYDNGGQETNDFKDTDIAFSPNWIAGSQLEYKLFKNFSIAWLAKYVGKQYLDNTSNENRKLNAYLTNDVRFSFELPLNFAKSVNISLLANNIFSTEYESNGYTYGYIFGGERITENFYYPQAGINFLGAVSLKF